MTDFLEDDERLLREVDLKVDECPSRWVEPMWNPETENHQLELGEAVCDREDSVRPWALVLDGGDLRDVERMLDACGAPSVRLTSGLPSGDEVPRRLLVASGNRALRFDARTLAKEDRVVTMAMLSNASATLASQVRKLGFDYVVERPVNTEALRHLILSALYRGDERRCEPRFSAGYPIRYRSGWRRGGAVLTELSRWGCSLRIDGAPKLKGHIKVCLPAEFTGKAPLVLAASVLRCERRARATLVSAAFHRDPKTRSRVGALLPQLRHGPRALPA